MSPESAESFRHLPSVDEVLRRLGQELERFPRSLLIIEIRRALEDQRRRVRLGLTPTDLDDQVRKAMSDLERSSMQRVINATGVVLHTNLGRAPLPVFTPHPGYSNLEYNLAVGRRGKRDQHLSDLFDRLLQAPAIAVNNNAAAVFLVLNEIAAGGEAIVSRGELIEIGDGFRIPEIMQRSGAQLHEVGTTNRTTIEDYRKAINERTRLILRVHPSNFHISGFTAKPALPELANLARESGIPLFEDLGSGCLVNLKPFGIQEPLVTDSLAAGVDLVAFSGDKLLGGPQAGIIAGNGELITRLRTNPIYRALRLDKVAFQGLEAALRYTLLERWDMLPALQRIRLSAGEIEQRAHALMEGLPRCQVIPGESIVGGGSTPDQALPTFLIAVSGNAEENEAKLRAGNPPVIARIEEDKLLFDLRTVDASEESELRAAIQALS